MGRIYIAIDLKSFYASVECVERGLDPLTARLVVADFSRTEKTICLAVSPALKALGLSGRERLYEVLRVTKAHGVDFDAAVPRMKKYMEVSRQIYGIYASFVSPHDIHVYSIDEVFIDATDYVKLYKVTAHEFAEMLIHKVLAETGITATAGIGTNMYLAKVAMDIKAKHLTADKHGVRIAELDEKSYREKLWSHQPLTDFWRVGPGYARRLQKLGINTMGDLARYSLAGADKLYAEFGINAELLIDHAWGWEPVGMADIKSYHTDNHSVSSGQVLKCAYNYEDARLVTWEMMDSLALELFEKKLMTNQIVLTVCYDKDYGKYRGAMRKDHYGRLLPKPAHGTITLNKYTNNAKLLCQKVLELYAQIVNRELKVKRIYVVAGKVQGNQMHRPLQQMDLFTDYEKQAEANEKNRRLQQAIAEIKHRYGKNALLKLANYEEGATMRERNMQVGGHRG